MKQLTVRGFDRQLEQRLRQLSRREGISLNQAALRLMRRGAGLEEPVGSSTAVGDTLDHLIGTWSDAEADAFDRAIQDFEVIDEDLWR